MSPTSAKNGVRSGLKEDVYISYRNTLSLTHTCTEIHTHTHIHTYIHDVGHTHTHTLL